VKSWIPDARNFAYLTWKQVDALDRETTVLVLPTAAIEQHGPHLPLATDTLINSILLGAALAQLPQGTAVYALPAICYGKSNEHVGFPGTLSVSASTFMAVVRDLGASISASGFKKLVLYNTHGGNSSCELHRGYHQAGVVATRKRTRNFRLADQGHSSQRSNGRPEPLQRREGHTLD
jgi:creatinine amidohydrolase